MNDPSSEWINYIKINGVDDPNGRSRGITVAKLISCHGLCHLEGVTSFDLAGSGGGGLSDWLTAMDYGTVVLAVSTDDASWDMAAARPALSALGVDTSPIALRWRLAFVVVVGRPDMTHMILEAPGAPAILTVTLTGGLI